MSTMNFRPFARKALMALAVVAVMGGAATAPALADDGWRGHQRFDHREAWRGHDDWRRHEWRVRERYAYPGPAYRYAPPAYYTHPSLNFVFPIR